MPCPLFICATGKQPWRYNTWVFAMACVGEIALHNVPRLYRAPLVISVSELSLISYGREHCSWDGILSIPLTQQFWSCYAHSILQEVSVTMDILSSAWLCCQSSLNSNFPSDLATIHYESLKFSRGASVHQQIICFVVYCWLCWWFV